MTNPLQRSLVRFALAAGLPLCAGQTLAQAWMPVEPPAPNTTAARILFDNGLTLQTRCLDGVFEVFIKGLPDAGQEQTTRRLSVSIGDDATESETWAVGLVGTTAFSRVPALFARQLLKGGSLTVNAPDTDGATGTSFTMALPSDADLVAHTLTTCGRPLIDIRDAALPQDAANGLAVRAQTASGEPLPPLTWERQPRPEYTKGAFRQLGRPGLATVSCGVQADGRLGDCAVESEYPPGLGLGRSLLLSTRRGLLRNADGSDTPMTGRLVVFSVVFPVWH